MIVVCVLNFLRNTQSPRFSIKNQWYLSLMCGQLRAGVLFTTWIQLPHVVTKSATECCLSPLPSSICCWEMLHQAACFCVRLAESTQREWHYGFISSASTHPDSLQLTVGWCWLRPACAWRWPCAWRQWAIRVHRSQGELRLSGQGCWDDEIEQAGLGKEIRFL